MALLTSTLAAAYPLHRLGDPVPYLRRHVVWVGAGVLETSHETSDRCIDSAK